MKFNIKIEKEVEATIIGVNGKVCDSGTYVLMDTNRNTIKEHDGYVPDFFPGGGGDYLELDIELATGKILNWKPPTKKQLEKFVSEEED